LQAGQATEEPPAAVGAETWQELSTLNLDCEADPASCDLAQHSNSYSADDDSSAATPGSASYEAAAAEAAAYLYASQAPSGWDAIIGGAASAPQQQPNAKQAPAAAAAAAAGEPASNSYEQIEPLWVQRRISEEAGAQYLDASALGLDCSGEQQDAPTAHECERSRAANRYEASGKVQVRQKGCQSSSTEIGSDMIAVHGLYHLQCRDVRTGSCWAVAQG
jgi:hypothetical protein